MKGSLIFLTKNRCSYATLLCPKALVLVAAICMNLIFIYYSADLTATMTSQPPAVRIKSFQDVEDQGGNSIGLLDHAKLGLSTQIPTQILPLVLAASIWVSKPNFGRSKNPIELPPRVTRWSPGAPAGWPTPTSRTHRRGRRCSGCTGATGNVSHC